METIEKNGEFENYVEMLAEREERERKALRKRERERNRLADGDAIISEEEDSEEEPLSDWSKSSSEPEVSDDGSELRNTGMEMGKSPGTPSLHGTRISKARSKTSHDDYALRFNALRFLALTLKSNNDSMEK